MWSLVGPRTTARILQGFDRAWIDLGRGLILLLDFAIGRSDSDDGHPLLSVRYLVLKKAPYAVDFFHLMRRSVEQEDSSYPRLGYNFQRIQTRELFPWFPDIYGFRSEVCGFGAKYLSVNSPLAGIIGLTRWNIHPLAVSIAYMAPLNILFNVWFWYFAGIILLTQVTYYMGYYSGLETENGCCRVGGSTGLSFGPPFKWIATSVGAVFGLSVFLLFVEGSFIRKTITAALGRISGERKNAIEKNEALSYRGIYALIVALFIYMVGILIAF